MDPLTFTIIATGISSAFLIGFGIHKYRWTKDLIWLLLIIIGLVFAWCSVSAVIQKRAIDRRLSIQYRIP